MLLQLVLDHNLMYRIANLNSRGSFFFFFFFFHFSSCAFFQKSWLYRNAKITTWMWIFHVLINFLVRLPDISVGYWLFSKFTLERIKPRTEPGSRASSQMKGFHQLASLMHLVSLQYLWNIQSLSKDKIKCKTFFFNLFSGTSLMIQWLGLQESTSVGREFNP